MTFNQPFRAIVSDLDGTLLSTHHVVEAYTKETLHRLAKQEIDIILATGRCYRDVSNILNKIGLEQAMIISSNGARAHNLQGELLFSDFLEENIAQQLMRVEFDDTRVLMNVYQQEQWFVNQHVPDFEKYYKDSNFRYQIVDFKQHDTKAIEKVFFIARQPEHLTPVIAQINQHISDHVSVTYSNPCCLEIMHRGVNKGAALNALLQQKSYQSADCIAFGDGMNDVEMLNMVGRGCIMGNADPRLVQALPHLTRIGLNRDESVAAYLRALFRLS